MRTNIVISKDTIENYKNNIDMLKGLKIRLESGSCSTYDMVLYQTLVKTNENEKNLKMTISA